MRIFLSSILSIIAFSGCSSSVRPPYSNTDDVTNEMIDQARSLNLAISSESTPVLAKSLSQAKSFCQMGDKDLKVEVRSMKRDSIEVPVIHLRCKP
ncbi:hypothetical protein [Alcanivorax jadensis]|uniref:hypothetical protein n=1 Tax=Alcanivorax jadensis TaxID=64988 RepID=UPI0026EE8333|nr:hypothetical protein [Alcanivorax jadensis]MCK5885622.1 hypothetical protein [Alcanivorax sp.]